MMIPKAQVNPFTSLKMRSVEFMGDLSNAVPPANNNKQATSETLVKPQNGTLEKESPALDLGSNPGLLALVETPWSFVCSSEILYLGQMIESLDASGTRTLGIMEHLLPFKMSQTSWSLLFDKFKRQSHKCQLYNYTKQTTNETCPNVPCTKLAKKISYQHPESPNRIVGFCCTQSCPSQGSRPHLVG